MEVPSLSLSHTLTHPLSLSLSLSHTHTHSLSPTHSLRKGRGGGTCHGLQVEEGFVSAEKVGDGGTIVEIGCGREEPFRPARRAVIG